MGLRAGIAKACISMSNELSKPPLKITELGKTRFASSPWDLIHLLTYSSDLVKLFTSAARPPKNAINTLNFFFFFFQGEKLIRDQ